MLTFGDQLYQLTLRDLTTAFVDPFFRSASSTLAAASANGNVQIPVPVDRSLFLHSFVIDMSAEAVTQWESWSIIAKRANNETVGFPYQRALVPVANQRISDTYNVGIILPPGIVALQFGPTRIGTTNGVGFSFTVNGYLIPPGKINRA